MSNENRLFLKTQLIRLIEEDLTAEESLSTEQHSRIYQTIRRLEKINPNPQPLTLGNLPKLVGDWHIFCSIKREHNVFGTQTTINKGTGINIKIKQNLTLDNTGNINSRDSLFIELSAFAEWKMEVEGVWNINSDNTALVKLKAFEFKLTQPFIIPGLKIPLFDFFPTEKLWKISYLDEDMLFGQDDSGTIFVFRKRM